MHNFSCTEPKIVLNDNTPDIVSELSKSIKSIKSNSRDKRKSLKTYTIENLDKSFEQNICEI